MLASSKRVGEAEASIRRLRKALRDAVAQISELRRLVEYQGHKLQELQLRLIALAPAGATGPVQGAGFFPNEVDSNAPEAVFGNVSSLMDRLGEVFGPGLPAEELERRGRESARQELAEVEAELAELRA